MFSVNVVSFLCLYKIFPLRAKVHFGPEIHDVLTLLKLYEVITVFAAQVAKNERGLLGKFIIWSHINLLMFTFASFGRKMFYVDNSDYLR